MEMTVSEIVKNAKELIKRFPKEVALEHKEIISKHQTYTEEQLTKEIFNFYCFFALDMTNNDVTNAEHIAHYIMGYFHFE